LKNIARLSAVRSSLIIAGERLATLNEKILYRSAYIFNLHPQALVLYRMLSSEFSQGLNVVWQPAREGHDFFARIIRKCQGRQSKSVIQNSIQISDVHTFKLYKR